KSRTGDRETQGAQARTRTGHHPAGELGQPGLTDTLPEPLRPPENTGEAKDPSKSSDKQDWEKPKRVQ
ncbi:MAG TPA: hypothetical protein VM681_05370, partial [Candidatus Thermoplasmatota archaeon]|nr:hypothetical protein [Candidatus Thermoplasmatota archaeon]